MVDQQIQSKIEHIIAQYPPVADIVQAVDAVGGRVLLVGGAVRDLLLGREVKDLDIEVHGISVETLERILRSFGPVSLVGKVYGVLRLHGLDIDWSLPRADAAGRKPEVIIDPSMSIEDAFRRRDLTINAMGIDLNTYALIDPFNGQHDLEHRILRAPDAQLFVEDPLRFFRVMQFIGRFGMQPDNELTRVCKNMDLSNISVERIATEFEKLLLRSKRPSLGFRWLLSIGRLAEILPELFATVGVEQNPQWHPEGDVFEHSMQTLDAAVALPYHDAASQLVVRYAALCHDLGKAVTTRELKGRIISYEHDTQGVPISRTMLKRITRKQDLIDAVAKLVRYHMSPPLFVKQHAKVPAYKRLARKLAPLSMNMLADVSLADRQGRNPVKGKPLTTPMPEIDIFKKKAAEYRVLDRPEEPLLLGRDLMDIIAPGKELGELLKKAYEIQLNESITDKQELKKRVLSGRDKKRR